MNSQLIVPPPSTRIVLIFFSYNFLSNNLIFTEFSPAIIISTGNLFNFSKFNFGIFFDTAIIVFISLHVCRIFDLSDKVPLESKIILIGFLPFE